MGTDPAIDDDIRDVRNTWTRLGAEDPMWAVLTDAAKADGRWEPDDFLATGVGEIAQVLGRLGELGVEPNTGLAVDIGCGAGRLTHGLAVAGFEEVIGVDISETMLETARRLVSSAAVDFRLGTHPDLAIVDPACADLVYCCRVLQHMPSPLALQYVRSFYRIARPAAVVVFQMPTAPARTPAGLALRVMPAPVARRLRQGMEMHGTPEARVRDIVAESGATVLTADVDTSAGPRWTSRLYVTRAAG